VEFQEPWGGIALPPARRASGPRVLEADVPEGPDVNGWRFPAGDCRVSMALAHHGGYWYKTVTTLEGDAVEEL
jgi:hypothetical protein